MWFLDFSEDDPDSNHRDLRQSSSCTRIAEPRPTVALQSAFWKRVADFYLPCISTAKKAA